MIYKISRGISSWKINDKHSRLAIIAEGRRLIITDDWKLMYQMWENVHAKHQWKNISSSRKIFCSNNIYSAFFLHELGVLPSTPTWILTISSYTVKCEPLCNSLATVNRKHSYMPCVTDWGCFVKLNCNSMSGFWNN